MSDMRHKQQKDENFPVASFLLGKGNRKIVTAYYNFARYGDDIADNPDLSEAEKTKRLEQLEQALYGKAERETEAHQIAEPLRKAFIAENLSFSLASDLLTAFRQDAACFHYETWGQLMAYCQHSAAPVGRFLLALHNENPSTYLPANALCAALQIVNHVQDLKYDAKTLKRVYIPDELFRRFDVSPSALTRAKSSKALKLLVKEIMFRVRGLMEDAAILPSIVRNLRLRLEICVIFSLTNIMLKKILKGVVLADTVRLNKRDWFCATIGGICRGLLTRHKTLTNKGL